MKKQPTENGNARDLKQENVCLYYINPKTGNIDALPQKIYDQDALLFLAPPAFTIDSSNKLCGTYFIRQIGDTQYYNLYYSTYTQKYLFQADYSQVNDAIAKATALNKDDYKYFTIYFGYFWIICANIVRIIIRYIGSFKINPRIIAVTNCKGYS